MLASTPCQIERRSLRFRNVVTVLFGVLVALLVLERFSAVTIGLVTGGFQDGMLRRFGFEVVSAAPEIFFLGALWGIRQALSEFAASRFYAPALTQMIARVGVMLALGGLSRVFLVPLLARLLGFNPGYLIAYDVSGLVLGVIGGWLLVISRILRRAAETQAELDAIF